MGMTLIVAHKSAGTLGFPSKMPGTSYGIPASACLVGSKLAQIKGSVCEGCYAFGGNYQYPSVKTSHETRLASIVNPQWVSAMVELLTRTHAKGVNRKGEKIASGWHRWHDSGDLQSENHLEKICAVATQTPHIRHWLPTREHGIVSKFVKKGGIVPDNLTIRISATMVDGAATKQWPQTSGVHSFERHVSPMNEAQESTHICPAPKQDNACGSCRACWSRDVAHVS